MDIHVFERGGKEKQRMQEVLTEKRGEKHVHYYISIVHCIESFISMGKNTRCGNTGGVLCEEKVEYKIFGARPL